MRRSAKAAHMGLVRARVWREWAGASLRQSGAFRSRCRGPRMARFRLAGPGFRATTWGAGDYMSLLRLRVPQLRNGSRIATVFGARPLAEAPPRFWRAELRGGAAWEGAQTGNRES